MRARRINSMAMAVAAIAATLACNQPVSRNPSAPSAPAVNTLEIVGPSSVAPGQPAQFSVNLRLADGTVKSGSTATDVRWRSTNTSVLQVASNGLATPVATQGDAQIIAEVRIGSSTRVSTKEVIVQPAGTFRLTGQVTEQGSPTYFIPDARVEVVGGGTFAITNGFGNYRLYGVPPSANIRVSANDYSDEVVPVEISSNTTRNFALPLTGVRPTFAGNYTLSIDVVTCGGF